MSEIPRSVELDLSERDEIRFILPLDREDATLTLLRRLFEPVVFSDKSISQTIYFNNLNHDVPWGYSLKARRFVYERSLKEDVHIDLGEPWFLEVKVQTSELGRARKRIKVPLSQAAAYLQTDAQLPFSLTYPLRPYLADEYERFHFKPKDRGSGMRVTCDLTPSYFLISEDNTVHFLGNEDAVRVEIKLPPYTLVDTDFVAQLRDLGARDGLSKKVAGYNLEAAHLRGFGDMPKKELTETEIESKLVVVDPDPSGFFSRLVEALRGGLGRFRIEQVFPFVFDSGSRNSYYLPEGREENAEGVKILERSTIAKAVLKSKKEVIDDKYGLGCILRRREVQTPYFPALQEEFSRILQQESKGLGTPLRYVGTVERLRRVVWPINRGTGRVYHVSIDRCLTRGNVFYELEVEYTGTNGKVSSNAEPVIIEDIADLTQAIIDTFPSSVRAEPLTKIEWIKSVS